MVKWICDSINLRNGRERWERKMEREMGMMIREMLKKGSKYGLP